MLVVNRFRVPAADAEAFRAQLATATAALSGTAGFEGADAGRNVDDPSLWVVVTRWRDIGSYRRALSSYDVKLNAAPLLGRAIDDPSAFEDLDGDLNRSIPRGTG